MTAGKYNDGARANRPVLAARIEAAMAAAWGETERQPLESASFRSVPLRFEPRTGPGYTPGGPRRSGSRTTPTRSASAWRPWH